MCHHHLLSRVLVLSSAKIQQLWGFSGTLIWIQEILSKNCVALLCRFSSSSDQPLDFSAMILQLWHLDRIISSRQDGWRSETQEKYPGGAGGGALVPLHLQWHQLHQAVHPVPHRVAALRVHHPPDHHRWGLIWKFLYMCNFINLLYVLTRNEQHTKLKVTAAKWVSFILGGFFLFWSKFRFIFSSNKLISDNAPTIPLSLILNIIPCLIWLAWYRDSPNRLRRGVDNQSSGSRSSHRPAPELGLCHTTLCFCQLTLSAYTSKRAGIFYPFPIDFLLPICKKTLI